MTKFNKILIYSFFLGTIFSLFLIKYINIGCLFKNVFSVPCPGCGLTRALISLFKLKFVDAFYYNFLIYPIVIIYFYCLYLIIIDCYYKSNRLIEFYNKFIIRHYKIIIILLIVSEFVNILHKI